MTLKDVKVGDTAVVKKIGGEGAIWNEHRCVELNRLFPFLL